MPADATLLKEVSLFEQLDDEERGILAEVIDLIQIKEGQPLFRAGDPGDAMYVVKSGSIELSVKDNAGQKIVLHIVEPGELFGELSMLDSKPRTATAIALHETELLELDRDDLILLFKKQPEAALHMMAAMGEMTRKADALLRTRVSKNLNEEIEDKATMVERVTDKVAAFSGSILFFGINFLWFASWIFGNVVGITRFDPYPFGLLTMIVSLQAIFLSILVMISQNRQAAKDRVRSDIEYEVNVKAELEVAHLHEKTDQIRDDLLDRFTRIEKALGIGARATGNLPAVAAAAAVTAAVSPAAPPNNTSK